MDMLSLLHKMVEYGASDIHIKAGSRPGFRIDGKILPDHEMEILTPQVTSALAAELMTDGQWERFVAEKDLDFSYAVTGLARFRVNALHQRTSVGMVIRQIPDTIPSAASLGLPDICIELAHKPRGLVLVTGATGSGKSTTLAAMVDSVNEREQHHILTMEDPLEFVHPDKKSFVTQRQIGQDSPSFKEALRRAMRQDPDVILIGEMRDLETIGMAITAAETGHLVFGTLHTTTAISTVDRIIDVFPTDSQQQVRIQFASTLQGVICQSLLPRVGGGRIAVREILVGTDAVRALIREGKTTQLFSAIQTGRASGMCTLEDELVRLCGEGLISMDDAISRANRPDDVCKRIADARAAQGPGSARLQHRTAAPHAGNGAAARARAPRVSG
jgi:twitching motility protein PilT